MTEIELPNSRIDKLCLSDSWDNEDENEGLLFHSEDRDIIVSISVVSWDQGFDKGFICTSLAAREESLVEEVNSGLLDVLLATIDSKRTACVKIKVRSIKSLEFKVFKEAEEVGPSLFDINLTFPQ